MRSQDRALYKSALRGKNTVKDQKLIHRVATSQRSQGLLGAIPPFPQSTTLKNFKRINTEMYEKKNSVIFAQFPLVIFGAFLSFLGRNFLEGVIICLLPKMMERSPVNFNFMRIFNSGKTVS